MSYNIFLSGGGSAKDTYALDDLFLKTTGKKILYLPVGLRRTFAGYNDCVAWFTNMITSHNLSKKISVWIDIKNKALEINTNNFDGIYIGGASDTFRLHNLLTKNQIYPQLISFVQQGGLIYGGSGGASILGKSINYDQKEKEQPKVKENSANLCMGYSVFAHLNEKNLDMIRALSDGDVIGIPEGGGCMLDSIDRVITYVGAGNALILSDQFCKILKNNESVKNI